MELCPGGSLADRPSPLPPSADDRSRELGVYRCVASLTDVSGVTGSVFRPR